MPDPVDLSYATSLPPEAAVRYFRSKGYAISWDWHDTLDEANARAFTVARVSRLDVLQDIRGALDTAIEEGKTQRWFQSTLTPVLQEKGWWGEAEAEIQPGQNRSVQLGSPRRLELIFRQNVQSALLAGRYEEFVKASKRRPFWMYIAVLDSKTRPSHAAMHGRVFRWDDPIWLTHWPPCGWNCRCRVIALSQSDVDRMGLLVESSAGRLVNKRVAVGVDYATGEQIHTDVTGIKLTGRDGKPITYFPDAGFNFNQSIAQYQPELDRYAPDVARQYARGVVSGPEFRRWFDDWSGRARSELQRSPSSSSADIAAAIVKKGEGSGNEYPLAILNESSKSALKTRSQTVRISTRSLVENLISAPGIGIDNYAVVQQLIDIGEIYKAGDDRVLLASVSGVLYRATIRADASTEFVHLLSLSVISEADAGATVRRIFERVR